MKRISLVIALIFASLTFAEVRTFYWSHPSCGMMRTMTSDPAVIAVMEAMLVDECEEEEPVDTGKKITKEVKDKLSSDDMNLVKPYKIKRHKWTDPETGKTYGDDKEYTVLKRFPSFRKAPDVNDI